MSRPGMGAAELHGFSLDDAQGDEPPTAYDFDVTRFAVALNDFKRAVSACAHSHGWWTDQATGQPSNRNMGEMLMLMTSELAEGLEAYRDGEPVLWYDYGLNNKKPTGDPKFDFEPELPAEMVTVGDTRPGEMVLGKPCGLASEFADTIIRILDTAHTLDHPVTTALVHKHRYNMTRPYRHGGKLA